MAGFASNNALMAAISAGQTWTAPFSKQFQPTAVAVANEWHTMTRGGGVPPADAIFDAGTNLLFQSLSDQTASNGGIYHGGDVGVIADDFKTLISGIAVTAAATVAPAMIQLVDILGFIRVTSITTTTAQTVIWPYNDGSAIGGGETTTFTSSSGLLGTYTNDIQSLSKVRFRNSGGALPTGIAAATDYWTVRVTATTSRFATSRANAIAGTVIAFTDAGTGTNVIDVRLPRYSDGRGVQALFFNPQATALGAGTPGLLLPAYQNSAGTTARATPSTPSLPIGKTAATSNHILYSGATGAGKFGPVIPLQSGDAGIRTVQQLRNNATYTSGMYTVALVVPLAEFPLQVLGQASMIDFTQGMFPSFPRVYDGAALYWLLKSGAATPVNSQVDGRLNFAWSV